MAQSSEEIIRGLALNAREAFTNLAEASSEGKAKALQEAARSILSHTNAILDANKKDVEAALKAGQPESFIDRLRLSEERIKSMASSIDEIAKLPDPVGKTLSSWTRPNGLRIERVSVPLGVIGVIYEARPNVTADAAAIAVKSGNAVILRGGSESFQTSKVIVDAIRSAFKSMGVPENVVQLVPTADREAVSAMLSAVGLIDIIVPRGGKGLTQKVQDESRVPTILHLDGNCHVYIHKHANPEIAIEVIANAKMRRTGICGATESLVVDREVLGSIFLLVAEKLHTMKCEIRGDEEALATAPEMILPATEEDYRTEYLAPIISVKTVSGIDEAIAHINKYGSHHTDAIITQNDKAAEQFLKSVDSAIVLHNASTQFADGGEFGFGAEIGIATGRLHARGPVGPEQLTTYKYKVFGTGQIRPV